MPSRVRVVVPASTANLGPGLGCLGLALGLYNTIELATSAGDAGVQMEITGEGTKAARAAWGDLIARAALSVWQAASQRPGALQIKAHNEIPLQAGLGANAAAAISGLAGANALLGESLSRSDLLRLARRLTGRSANAAAAFFGGLTMVSVKDAEVRCQSLETSLHDVVAVLPQVQFTAEIVNGIVPGRVLLADAMFHAERTAFVIQALRRGDFELLRWAMDDRIQLPFVQKHVTGYEAVAQAAQEQGAAIALSGDGPGLIALAPEGHEEIASAMKAAFARAGVDSQTFVLPVDRQGVQISVSG